MAPSVTALPEDPLGGAEQHGPGRRQEEQRRGRAGAKQAVAVGAVLLVVTLGLAACGGGSSGLGVASVGSTTTTAAPSSAEGSTPPSAGPARTGPATMLKYSQCMRAHGIADFPDPSSNGSISLHVQPGSDLNPHAPQFQAAQNACKSLSPGGALTPGQEAAANARALRYSQCMRSNGIADFPDPNGQGTLTIDEGTGDLDPNSTRFKAAEKACRSLDTGFNTNENDLSPPPPAGQGSTGR